MTSNNTPLLVLTLLLLQSKAFMIMTSALTNQDDVDALIALHNAWNGNPSSWDTKTDPCTDLWLGIYCNDDATRVTRLILIDQSLAGTISPNIGNLSRLLEMDLSSNPNLGGTIPTEISKLTRLQRLFIQNCNLSGIIPSEIGNLTKLQYFGLTDNRISGQLPTTIGFLENIIWLDVAENGISGPLLVSNMADGGVGLDNLTKAKHFHLEINSFSGTIPPSLFNTRLVLVHILLYNNDLIGSIPSTIADLRHVEIIRLDNNRLNGTIPDTISSITNLTTLQLNNNNINGRLPDLTNNTKLQILMIGSNLFEPFEIPTWITTLTQLHYLSMDSASLTGNIPIDLFKSKPSLTNVSMAHNRLNGSLNLTTIDAPLLIFNLTDNDISNVDKGNYSDVLILDGNPYCQTVTNGCDSTQSSTIAPAPSPPTSDMSICTRTCSSNYAMNPKLNACACVRPVVAECQFYAVKLPVFTTDDIAFIERQYVTKLNDNKVVQGSPFELSQVVVLFVTSSNMVVTVFPPNTSTLWSYNDANNLTYAIKNQDIQFPNIGPMSCEYTAGPYAPAPITPGSLSTGAKIGIGIGAGVLGISLLLMGLYAIRQRRRALKAEELNKPFASWIAAAQKDVNVPQMKGARWFSLAELRSFTNDFDAMHELGEGGYGKVYKGMTPSDEELAIKRARVDSLQGAAEFKNEIEILSRVHHRNLVSLIGFCFEEGEQMLVYEFMPNGTLRDYLSDTGKCEMHMDWDTRIRLALDSARGIAYLHNEANPPIIHGDIKSTNILLDRKLVAKVADFGLCKLVSDESFETNPSTTVRGTMGYLDPEYYLTHILTDKSDVYSFGVVLMELITGRSPFQGGRYIVHELTTTLEKSDIYTLIETLVDPCLTGYKINDLETLVNIAVGCVKDQRVDRPHMMAVVKQLEALVQENNAEIYTKMETAKSTSIEKPSISLYNKDLFVSADDYESSTFGFSGSYNIPRNVEPK